MHNYKVNYRDSEGIEHFDEIKGCNPGNALAKYQKANPGATMLRVILGNESAWKEYTPPPVQRDPRPEPKPFRGPKPAEKDGTMPFYDEVVGSRPDLSP